jgi:hypothetical protein
MVSQRKKVSTIVVDEANDKYESDLISDESDTSTNESRWIKVT